VKALIIGYGSIGQRHARLMADLNLDVAVVSRREVDVLRHYKTTPEAIMDWRPDYVIIASGTNEHATDVAVLAEADFRGAVLIEKPLFGTTRNVPNNKFRSIHVAYNLRAHPVLQAFRQAIAGRSILAFRAHTGQYLPEWRPGTDYRLSYSAHRDKAGGVLRDLSHELDYATWLCGPWLRVAALGGKFSHLEIDSADVFSILMETEACPAVSIHMNYLQDMPQREIVAITETGTLRADLIANTVSTSDGVERFNVDRDDSYLAQHRAVLESKHDSLCSALQGQEIDALIVAAEWASQNGKWAGRHEVVA
jgi:predicted dehydrogenase